MTRSFAASLLENPEEAYRSVDELVHDCWKRVYNYVYWLVGHRQEAEDITQITFQKIFHHWSTLARLTRYQQIAFLYQTARTTTIDVQRKAKRERRFLETAAPSSPPSTDFSSHRIDIPALLRTLPDRQREVLLLRVARYTNAEIGKILGLSAERARQLFQQAVKTIGPIMEQYDEDA